MAKHIISQEEIENAKKNSLISENHFLSSCGNGRSKDLILQTIIEFIDGVQQPPTIRFVVKSQNHETGAKTNSFFQLFDDAVARYNELP